jgi:hypothetical protein
MARLHHTRGQVADVIEQARKVQELMSGFVKRHFESIPAISVTASPHIFGVTSGNSFHIRWEKLLTVASHVKHFNLCFLRALFHSNRQRKESFFNKMNCFGFVIMISSNRKSLRCSVPSMRIRMGFSTSEK